MTIVTVASVKGAPGCTTVSCLIASAWPSERRVVLVEGDPSGGDLAARFRLSTRRGLSSFAAASRRLEDFEPIGAHVQQLPGGVEVLVGAKGADASTDQSTVSSLLSSASSRQDEQWDVIADIGRLLPGERGVELWLEHATAVAIVLRRDAASILHVRDRASKLRSRTKGRVGLVLIGRGPFPSNEIERFTELPVLAELPEDRNAGLIAGGHPGGPSRLSRSLVVLASARLAATLCADDRPLGPGHGARAEGADGVCPPATAGGTRRSNGPELPGNGWGRPWSAVFRAARLKPRIRSSPNGPMGRLPEDAPEEASLDEVSEVLR